MIALRAILAAGIALASTGVSAATLIPLADDPGGQSGDTSAEQWLSWVLSFDLVTDGGDPITDATGAFQNFHQIYPVKMVGGTFGGDIARSFTVEGGKPFMIPLVNSFCFGDTANPPPLDACEGAGQANANEAMDNVDRLLLKIDGNVLVDADTADEVDAIESAYRIQTGIFPVDVAPNSVYSPYVDGGIPAGVYDSSFNYGFYAFANLPVGAHVVEYGGGFGDFFNSVTANITVAPVPLPPGLPLLAGGLLALGLAARRRVSPA